MAVLALTALPSALGATGATATILGAVGAAVGSYIDQKYTSRLFNQPGETTPVEGAGFNDQKIQNTIEGAVDNYIQGQNIVETGTVIWHSGIFVSGGVNKAHFAIAFCQQEVEDIPKVWAGSDVIYDDSIVNLEGIVKITSGTTFESAPSAGGVDFTLLNPGMSVTVAGFANPSNNGTFTISTVDVNPFAPTFTRMIITASVLPGAGNTAGVTITPNQPIIDSRITDVTVYTGTEVQTQDPLIDAAEGASNNVPYRGTAYIVIEGVNLDALGVNPTFKALIQESSTRTVAEGIENILGRFGYTSSDYDTTDVTTQTLRGYSIKGIHNGFSQLAPLLNAYFIRVQYNGTKLRFFSRENATQITVDEINVGAADEDGANENRPIKFNQINSIDVPKHLSVQYISTELDFQTGAIRESRIDATSPRTDTIRIPIVFTGQEARDFAQKTIWKSAVERASVELTLPPKFINVEEGDVLVVAYNSEIYFISVSTVTIGSNYLVEISGMLQEDQTISDITSTVTLPEFGSGGVSTITTPILIVMDVAPLADSDIDSPGIYFATANISTTGTWNGASLYDSSDNVSFSETSTFTDESVIGRALTVLPTVSKTTVIDRGSTVQVELYSSGTLSSITQSQLIDGQNFAYLGGELIGFQTATFISGTTWELSNFIRGCRNTEDKVSTHAVDEFFVLLNSLKYIFVPYSSSLLNATRYFKSVPALGAVADYTSESEMIALNTLRPFTPTNVRTSMSASNNLTIDWDRRDRAFTALLSSPSLPDTDGTEQYVIEILDGDGGNILTTIGISGATTYTFFESQAISAGLVPGVELYFNIRSTTPTYPTGSRNTQYLSDGKANVQLQTIGGDNLLTIGGNNLKKLTP